MSVQKITVTVHSHGSSNSYCIKTALCHYYLKNLLSEYKSVYAYMYIYNFLLHTSYHVMFVILININLYLFNPFFLLGYGYNEQTTQVTRDTENYDGI
jgi:hypothetical protein